MSSRCTGKHPSRQGCRAPATNTAISAGHVVTVDKRPPQKETNATLDVNMPQRIGSTLEIKYICLAAGSKFFPSSGCADLSSAGPRDRNCPRGTVPIRCAVLGLNVRAVSKCPKPVVSRSSCGDTRRRGPCHLSHRSDQESRLLGRLPGNRRVLHIR